MHPTFMDIRTEETYLIRMQILRPGGPIEEIQFEGDSAATSFHLGRSLMKN